MEAKGRTLQCAVHSYALPPNCRRRKHLKLGRSVRDKYSKDTKRNYHSLSTKHFRLYLYSLFGNPLELGLAARHRKIVKLFQYFRFSLPFFSIDLFFIFYLLSFFNSDSTVCIKNRMSHTMITALKTVVWKDCVIVLKKT